VNVFLESSLWANKQSLPLLANEVMTSTNDVAKEEALTITEDFKLYLADHQTHGRGRFDRIWNDDKSGAFLLSTWSYRVQNSPSPVVTARIGLAVVEAFHQSFPSLKWSLKAPNDILLNGKKVCGLLTEVVSQGSQYRLIVGLGVNFSRPPEGINMATSLLQEDPGVSSKIWIQFLNALKKSLDELVPTAHVNQMEPSEGSKILDWLNKNPNLKDLYSEVGLDGSLTHGGQKLNWMDL